MTRPDRLRPLVSACFAASALFGATGASAQAPPLNESIIIGAWTFRPSVEARLRGEYRNDPFGFDQGGLGAVLADGYNTNLPPGFSTALIPAQDGWAISERVRVGIAVDRGPVTAVVKLQDARVLGGAANIGLVPALSDAPPGAGFAPYEAYLDIHSRSGRAMFLRLGRQAVQWGDGRLIGTNDFTTTGRVLDAARFGVEAGDFDFEGMAALLGYPYIAGLGGLSGSGTVSGTGAQLYGLKITGHFLPLLQIEATGLARIVRDPIFSAALTPSDTFVGDLRVYGSHRGFQYSLEGAYQGGQVASYEDKLRSIEAFAIAGRFAWETALPWHMTFGAQGAYATGDKGTGSPDEPMTRFDPILPDQTINHSRMSLYAWSNLIEAGGDISVRPMDELGVGVGYRFVGLADPKGRWVTGALTTVGSDPNNDSSVLGQEIDFTVRVTPWDPISFQAGYGLFLLGDGGKNILATQERAAEMQHWGYLQATIKAP